MKHLIVFAILLLNIGSSKGQNCEGPLTVMMVGASTSQPITIEEETSGVYCTQSNEGAINIQVYGGTPQYMYNWEHEAIDQSYLIDIPAGSYHVTVTDAHGCTEERTITIVQVDPLTDSLDLVDVSSCGSCYMNDGTQSFFYFEDDYIGAIVDIKNDIDLGSSMICTEISDQQSLCKGHPVLNRKWCFQTDSIEHANVRLFFSEKEFKSLAHAAGFENEIQMINSGNCYLKIFDIEEDDCENFDPKRELNQFQFTTTRFDEENGVWSIEIPDIDDACVMMLAFFGGTTLPVELLSFDGEILEDKNRLTWKTANETNNEGFHLEKSKNGLDFESIGFVESKESIEAEYLFDDLDPWLGSNYYKLKQIDKDGTSTDSHIIHLQRRINFDFDVLINPFRENLKIQVNTGSEIDALIAVYDINGQLLIEKDAEYNAGTHVSDINLSALLPGNYIVRFYNRTQNQYLSKKIVKI